MSDNNIENVSVPTIGEYLAHKNVFITGGTGFLGTALIEALLSATPDIGIIYVLIRDKYKSNQFHELLPKEVNSKIYLVIISNSIDRLCYLLVQLFQRYSEETMNKLIPIIGVIDKPKFDMTDDRWTQLTNDVNIVIHIAAEYKFNLPLRNVIRTNLKGTLRSIELVKSLKNLSSYVYLSTAFCNSNRRGFICDNVYRSRQDPYEMMRLADDDEIWLNSITPDKCANLIDGHPNTYTFSKQLCENLVNNELMGWPAAIVRPSAVFSTYKYPFEGWCGAATSMHLSVLKGYYKGRKYISK